MPRQVLEPRQVEPVAWDLQHVAPRPRHEDVSAEDLSKKDDSVLERRRRRPWRLLTPKLVDDPLRRDDSVRAQEQDGEQRTLALSVDRKRAVIADDLEWSE
jgi:hypothetical protein